MPYNIGDFITTSRSSKPAVIINIVNVAVAGDDQDSRLLISIDEYNGDYMWIYTNEVNRLAELNSEEKLSILANFGSWFYDQHKLIYQELIIENLGA